MRARVNELIAPAKLNGMRLAADPDSDQGCVAEEFRDEPRADITRLSTHDSL